MTSYMSSKCAAHIYRGYVCTALKNDVVLAIINGAKNRNSEEVHVPRLAVTPQLLKSLKTGSRMKGFQEEVADMVIFHLVLLEKSANS